jgi:3'-phosphoadenosine 5'-phosphosulfate (PAPS) 3'-phosphatase
VTSPLLQLMIDTALEAGAEIECCTGAGCAAETKQDGSPVTEADLRAEAIILRRLRAAYPDIPILAEEEACEGCLPDLGVRFFLVDALDGTRGFIERNGEFTVNVALVAGAFRWRGGLRSGQPRPSTTVAGRRGGLQAPRRGPLRSASSRARTQPQGLTAIVSRASCCRYRRNDRALGASRSCFLPVRP